MRCVIPLMLLGILCVGVSYLGIRDVMAEAETKYNGRYETKCYVGGSHHYDFITTLPPIAEGNGMGYSGYLIITENDGSVVRVRGDCVIKEMR